MKQKFRHIKLDYLEEICEGNDEFKKEMIHIFLEQVPAFISNMNKYLEQGNNEELAKEAHTAKSSALIFMMDETGDTLKRIQTLAKKNDKETLPSLVRKAEISLNSAAEELKAYLKESD